MNPDFQWINLIILFGAVHGLIFGVIVLFNSKHPGAPFLGLFMFVLAYNGFQTLNWSAGLDQYIILFGLFPFIVIFAAEPSLYLCVTQVTSSCTSAIRERDPGTLQHRRALPLARRISVNTL